MKVEIPSGIRHCVAKETSRYALNGVEARPVVGDNSQTEAYLSATDGRMLAVVTVEAEELAEPTIIPADVLPTRNGGDTIVLEHGSFRSLAGGRIAEAPDEGAFPPTADVVPAGDTFKLVVGLNAELLAKLAKAVGEDGTVTLLIPGKAGKPIGVMGSQGFGVQMPLNTEPDSEACLARWDRDADAYRDACKPKPEPSPTDRKIMGDDAAERHAAIAP